MRINTLQRLRTLKINVNKMGSINHIMLLIGKNLTRKDVALAIIFIYAKHYNQTFVTNFHFPPQIQHFDNNLLPRFFTFPRHLRQ